MDHATLEQLSDDEKLALISEQAARIAALEARIQALAAAEAPSQPLMDTIYTDALDQANVAMVLINAEYRVIYASSIYLAWRGQAAEAVMGAHMADLMGWDRFKNEYQDRFDQAFNGETQTYQQTHYYDPGTREIIITLMPATSTDGKIIGALNILRDVTEIKQTQRQLAESEQQYRLISEMTSDYSYRIRVFDENNFTVEWIGGAFEAITSFTLDEISDLSEWDKVVHPDDVAYVVNATQHLIKTGESAEIRYRVVTKDGVVKTLQNFHRLEKTDNGTFIYGSATDITAQQQAEDALNESQQHYKLLAEMTSDYAYTARVDPDGEMHVDWLGGAFEEITGYDFADINSIEDWAKMVHPADLQVTLGMYARLVETGSAAPHIFRLITKDGVLKIMRSKHVLRRTDKGLFIHGAAEDITAQKDAEYALRESEQRYKTLSELGSDYAYGIRIDEDGTEQVEWVVGAIDRIIGISTEQAVANNLKIPNVHPEDVDQLRAAWRRVVSTGTPEDTFYRVRGRDGEWRHMHNQQRLEKDPVTGRVTYVYLVARDITEQQQAEDALRKSEQRYRTISELTSDYAYGFRITDDNDIRLIWVTGAFATITGYPEDDLFHNMETWRFLTHPDDIAYMDEQLANILKDHQPQVLEYRIVTKDGETRHVRGRHRLAVNPKTNKATHLFGAAQDITEQKQAEDALRKSEQRYRILTDLGSDYAAGFVIEADGIPYMEWVSEAVERITGYAAEEYCQLPVQTPIHPDDRVPVRANTKHMLASGKPSDSMYRIIRKDGAERHIHSRHHLVKDPQTGRVTYVYMVAQDITERILAEDERKASEYRYRSLFEQAQDAIFIIDVDGKRMETNSYAALMLGYTLEELNTMNAMQVVAPQDLDHRNNILERLTAGEIIPPYERNFVHKDGSLVPVEINVQVIYNEDGKPIAIQSIARDLRERKRLEAAQRAYEAYFGALMDTDALGVHVFDMENKTIQANNTVARMLGYTLDEFMALESFSFLHPEDAAQSLQEYLRLIDGEIDHIRTVTRNLHKDGSIVWADVIITCVRDGDGNAQYAISITSDITAQKQAEEDQRNLDLERQKVKLIAEFIGKASHEFRTPLSRVNTNLYMLKRVSEDERAFKYIDRIADETDHIVDLVESLLQMINLERDSILHANPLRVNELLDMMYVDYAGRCEVANVKLKLKMGDVPLINGNIELLESALDKLLDNALRHTTDGDTITLGSSADATHAFITITDTGMGISAAAMPRIFDRFFRVDTVHSTPGFGLGLTIARKIVEQHGGTLSASSTEGEGSTFTVRLPLPDADTN